MNADVQAVFYVANEHTIFPLTSLLSFVLQKSQKPTFYVKNRIP